MKYILYIIAFVCISGTLIYQGVRHDTTMTDDGITKNELKVDTTIIQTVKKGAGGRYTYISPSQITSDQDNYNPTGFGAATHVRLSGDNGIRAITSFVAPSAVTDVYEKVLINTGSFPIYFPGESPDGSAANRITLERDFIVYPYQSCKIWYDIASSRWRLLSDGNTQNKTGLFYSASAGSITQADSRDVVVFSGGTATGTASTTSLPACFAMGTSTSSTGFGYLYFSKTSQTFTAFGSAHIFCEAYISLPVVSDGTNTYQIVLDITNSVVTNTIPNNSIGIRYTHATNSGKWQVFSKDNAGSESTADSGVTVSAATLYKLRIEIDKSKTEARAYINDVYVARVTGNMPNSVVCGAKINIFKSVGATERIMNIHSFNAGAIYP